MRTSPRHVSFLVSVLALACGGSAAAEGFEVLLKCEDNDKNITKIIRMNHGAFDLWDEENAIFKRSRCDQKPESWHGKLVGTRTTCTFNPRYIEFMGMGVESSRETLKLHFKVNRETGHFSLKVAPHELPGIKQAIDMAGTCAPTELPKPPKTLF